MHLLSQAHVHPNSRLRPSLIPAFGAPGHPARRRSRRGAPCPPTQRTWCRRCVSSDMNLLAHARDVALQSPLLVLGGVALTYAVYTLIRFARADASLGLLSAAPTPPRAFAGKVVWIVGSSQGLGEAMALCMAAQGAKLILSSRSQRKLEAVKAKCAAFIPADDVLLLRLDVLGPPATLAEAVETACSAFGGAGLDYIFHNAGASQHAVVEETTCDVATELLHLNLHAAINVARATLPYMLRRGKGWHVVISSMAGVVPSPGQAVYAAAKAGLRAYFGSLKAEMHGSGIGATICCPGPVATGLDGNARLVYGPLGLIETVTTVPSPDGEGSQLVAAHSSSGRTAVPRAVELIVRAAHRKMDEVWIARHPVLLVGYLTQYTPFLAWWILKKIGPGRARKLKSGGDGYSVTGMFVWGTPKKTE
ncbi:hypothetical protein ACKKBG_A26525 [Auxenochlorella protothecoides x Auxenochlorella symbiontica]